MSDDNVYDINRKNFETICDRLMEEETCPEKLISYAGCCAVGRGIITYRVDFDRPLDISVGAMIDLNRAERFVRRALYFAVDNIYSEFVITRQIREQYLRKLLIELSALNQFNAENLNVLGYLYHHGIGFDKDLKIALELYNIAAANGSVYASRNIALCRPTHIIGSHD
jgi:hypothetical protein